MDKIKLELSNGCHLVAETPENGEFNELYVYIEKDGIAIQDIALFRENMENKALIETLLWGDQNDEDYTMRFLIPQYVEE